MEPYLLPIAQRRFLAVFSLIYCLATLLMGCGSMQENQREDPRKAIVSLLNSYLDALKERNAEKVISCFLDSPEFLYYLDGMPRGYEQTVAGMRASLSSLKSYEGRLDTAYVSVLNSETVAAAIPFHYAYTDKNGVETRLKGEITWIAVRKGSTWKFIYAHGFDQPDKNH